MTGSELKQIREDIGHAIGKSLSAATMTIILMACSQRIRRHRHATQRDRGCESDKSFFVKHVILLCFKRKFVCDCNGNAGSPLKVARPKGHVRVSDRNVLRLNCFSK